MRCAAPDVISLLSNLALLVVYLSKLVYNVNSYVYNLYNRQSVLQCDAYYIDDVKVESNKESRSMKIYSLHVLN